MDAIKSKLLNGTDYFEKNEIVTRNIRLKKPNAVLFDWENTIIKRNNNFSFEITDLSIIKLLELLKKYKIYTAIVSNKSSAALNNDVMKLGLNKFFNKILGRDDSPEPKPSIEMMVRAIDDSEIEFGENIWMIGDSETDLEFAKMSLATGILFAKFSDDSMDNYASNLKINSFTEIIDFIEYFYNKNIS